MKLQMNPNTPSQVCMCGGGDTCESRIELKFPRIFAKIVYSRGRTMIHEAKITNHWTAMYHEWKEFYRNCTNQEIDKKIKNISNWSVYGLDCVNLLALHIIEMWQKDICIFNDPKECRTLEELRALICCDTEKGYEYCKFVWKLASLCYSLDYQLQYNSRKSSLIHIVFMDETVDLNNIRNLIK